ncbi:MAG: Mycothiol acetyltransferase [Acidobacteria bacterium OLB17]|nr:MAG: Mycothiol acetyltransferase [Acidobacteria bacterium OLB17]MCZ2390265.1 GNAT family N-acetyltransferase [Acidobacteriota bacterium]
MQIRKAHGEDTGSLVKFNQAMAFETEGKTLDREVLAAGVKAVFGDEDRGFYVVAEEEGEIVGGLLVTREWSDWRNAWFWWIQSVYVIPEARGKGVYSKLSKFVRTMAVEAGNVCGIRLYVEKENNVAQAVYQRLGMHETEYLMYEQTL